MSASESGSRNVWASRPLKDEYRNVLDAIRIAAPRPAYSDVTVEGFVDTLLQAALIDPARISPEVQMLRGQLEHPLVTHLYIPLDGIQLEETPLSLGDVILIKMSAADFERLILEPFQGMLSVNPYYNDLQRGELLKTHRERMSPLQDRICVEITTRTDVPEALGEAKTTADDVCNFLQVCLAFLAPPRFDNPVRWSTGVVSAWRRSFAISDGPISASNTKIELAFGGPPSELRSEDIARLKDAGLLSLGSTLGREPSNEYCALLRRAVRWFAKGERERHPDDRKLAYVTAVDLFFSQPPGTQDGLNVTQRFCYGAAFALADDAKRVAEIARSLVATYNSRSETSHEGAVDIETTETADRMRTLLVTFLGRMARQVFKDKTDVATWLAQRRAALSTSEHEMLNEATSFKVVLQDQALVESVAMLRAGGTTNPVSPGRKRYILAQLLADALRSRSFLLQLRPLAEPLRQAIVGARANGDDVVDAALAELVSLPWVASSLKTRLDSPFT
jgi:hypothetical protein